MAGTGQASTETLILVGIVLLVFVVVLIYYSQNQRFLADLKAPWDKDIECEKYAEILSSVYNKGPGTQWVLTLDKKLFIAESLLYMYDAGETINDAVVCNHFAKLYSNYTATGDVTIVNIGGKVSVIGANVQ